MNKDTKKALIETLDMLTKFLRGSQECLKGAESKEEDLRILKYTSYRLGKDRKLINVIIKNLGRN
jgi:hypothetical protein